MRPEPVRRRLLASIPLVLVILGGCTSADSDPNFLAIPDVGGTRAAFLEDGHPVFVVHDLDGTIHVIDAISTHIAEDQMAWCPSSRTIDDVFHGARWDPQGRYVSGPGPTDLGRYIFELADGESALTVSAYLEPTLRSESSVGMAGPSCVDSDYQIHPFHETE